MCVHIYRNMWVLVIFITLFRYLLGSWVSVVLGNYVFKTLWQNWLWFSWTSKRVWYLYLSFIAFLQYKHIKSTACQLYLNTIFTSSYFSWLNYHYHHDDQLLFIFYFVFKVYSFTFDLAVIQHICIYSPGYWLEIIIFFEILNLLET